MLATIKQAVDYIFSHTRQRPEVGIILGTGLGGLVDEIENQEVMEYKSIPNFPLSTVQGHSGRLIFGMLGGKCVVAMQGRFHYYEGYTMQQVTFAVRVMKFLGIKTLFVSNASGGLNPTFEIGDLMVINDHINLLPNPLIGPNDDTLGVRFPDMSEAYDRHLIDLALSIGQDLNVKLQQGCYVGTSGPTFETPKEYAFFRTIGGDAVGMSTVPEVIVARHMGLPVFAMSIITDMGVAGRIVEVSHQDVQEIGKRSEKKMTRIMKEMLVKLVL